MHPLCTIFAGEVNGTIQYVWMNDRSGRGAEPSAEAVPIYPP